MHYSIRKTLFEALLMPDETNSTANKSVRYLTVIFFRFLPIHIERKIMRNGQLTNRKFFCIVTETLIT